MLRRLPLNVYTGLRPFLARRCEFPVSDLTHFDESGASRMVDVGEKPVTSRRAVAEAVVQMQAGTQAMIREARLVKGDVLEVARLAGITATKRTADLIPLCHSLPLDAVTLDFEFLDETRIRIVSDVSNHGRTGVEMEALVAVTTAALTIYDMCKSVDREMEINTVRLMEKSGGRSGHFLRDEAPATEET